MEEIRFRSEWVESVLLMRGIHIYQQPCYREIHTMRGLPYITGFPVPNTYSSHYSILESTTSLL